jgi:hypothetical protein
MLKSILRAVGLAGEVDAAKRAGREAAIFCAYLLMAIVVTWPLAARLDTAVSDLGDPLLNAWIIDWDCHALTHAPLHIFDAPIFYPSKLPLAYSENLIGIALVALPFHFAGLPPLAVYNIAILLGFAISSYAGYLLARVVTRKTAASAIAGLLYGFVPYKLGQLAHVQIIWSATPALLLAALILYRRKPSKKYAALVAIAFAVSAIINIYLFLFGAVALALTVALIAIAETRDRRFWLTLLVALAIAVVAVLPVLMPYAIVAKEYDMRRGDGETLGASATPADWLVPSGNSAVYASFVPDAWHHNERELFPGLLLIALTIIAFARKRPADVENESLGYRFQWLDALIVLLVIATAIGLALHSSTIPMALLIIAIIARLPLRVWIARSPLPIELWIAALWIVIGVIGSLGLHAFFHSILFHDVPGFRATRAPARWALIAYAGLAASSAVALARMKRRTLIALALLAAVDVWPRIRWEHALREPAPFDRWLAATHAGPLIELPLRNDLEYLYMFGAASHDVLLINGISGFEPPLHRRLRTEPLGDTTFDLLEKNECRFVLIHIDSFNPLPGIAFDWIRRGLDEGRLVFVRRFDHEANGDWLFALQRGPRAVPNEELQRLLDGKPTYNHATFGRIDQPRYNATVTGPLDVSGWALSPAGISEVDVLIDSGRVHIVASRTPNAQISGMFPMYPKTTLPSFSAHIERRPPGVPEKTDVQVAIVDSAGHITRMPDLLVTWRK